MQTPEPQPANQPQPKGRKRPHVQFGPPPATPASASAPQARPATVNAPQPASVNVMRLAKGCSPQAPTPNPRKRPHVQFGPPPATPAMPPVQANDGVNAPPGVPPRPMLRLTEPFTELPPIIPRAPKR